jgi:hypothetical protein
MKLNLSKEDVWVGDLKDRPGGLAEKLKPLADAGVNLKFVIARREGKGKKATVFLTPIKGSKQVAAAKKVGLKKAKSIQNVRVEGIDKPGRGAKITAAIADAGINLHGLSAATIGKKFILYLGLDSKADATKVMNVLKKL